MALIFMSIASVISVIGRFIFLVFTTLFFNHFFSLMMSLKMISSMRIPTMMVLGQGYLVNALFHFLKILLVVSVDYFHLVKSL